LRFDGVLGLAEERFDAQVLLDPLEEKLDLPMIFVELGNRHGRQRKIGSSGNRVGDFDRFRSGICFSRWPVGPVTQPMALSVR
jgi:hypothetical protein